MGLRVAHHDFVGVRVGWGVRMTCLSNWTDAAEELSARGVPVPAIALDARRLEAVRAAFRTEDRGLRLVRVRRALSVIARKRKLQAEMELLSITPEGIVAEELARLGLPASILDRVGKKGGTSRAPEAVEGRGRLFVALRERGMSYPAIARACGLRGHSGIHESVARVKREGKIEQQSGRFAEQQIGKDEDARHFVRGSSSTISGGIGIAVFICCSAALQICCSLCGFAASPVGAAL